MRTQASLLLALFLILVPALAGAAAPIPIGGQVFEPGGSPLEGARVLLMRVERTAEASRLELEGKADPDPVATATTGADGGFRLQAPEAGMWKVAVQARGMVPQEALLLPLTEETELPSVRLERDTRLEVRVTGADGKLLAGARVRVGGSNPMRRFRLGPDWRTPDRAALTDGKGLAVLPRGSREQLLVRAGAAGQPFAEQEEVRSGSVSLRLPAGTAREIRVMDASGKKPEPGVYVRVGENSWIAGRTSEDGRFSIPLAMGRKEKVSLSAEDGRGLETYAEPLKEGEKGPRTLRLPVLETLAGRVVSAADGRPVAGALVWSQEPGEARRTGADGVYRLDVVAGRDAWIQTAAPGFLGADDQVGVQTGTRRGPTLALEPALAAAGVVVDEQGRPVPGVEVRATPQLGRRIRSATMRSGGTSRTSGSGRFRFGGLAAGLAHELRLSRAGFAPATAEVPPLQPGRPVSDLRIVLRKGRTGFGHVVDQAGQPVAGAQVVLRSAARGDMRMRVRNLREPEPPIEAATDAKGRFELRDLPPGNYELTARGAGYAPLTVPGLEVPQGGGSTDLGTVTLVPGVALEGYATDPQGQPVAGAEVRVIEASADRMSRFLRMDEAEPPPAATSGQDGFFRVEDRRAGETVDLDASRPGYAPASAPGVRVPTEQPVRLVLQPSAAVEGRVVDPDGKPVPGTRVVVDPADPMAMGRMRVFSASRMRQAVADESGFFRVEDVIPGAIEVRAIATGYTTAELKNLEVRPGQELRGVEVVLAPGAVIEGRVFSPSGKPLVGATVSLSESSGFTFRGGASDGDGRYRLDGIPPGTRIVQAEHEDYRRAVRELEVRLGENSLDLRLEGGVEVSGRVVDEGGVPVPSARVLLREGSNFWDQPGATSGADGSFTLSGVADGTYRVLAEKEGFARSPEGIEVKVAGSSVGGVEVKLTSGGAIVGQLSGLEFNELSEVQVSLRGRGFQAGRVLPDGTYRIDHVGPGDHQVVATLPGSTRQADGHVTLEPGASEARLDLEFGGGHTLSGRVIRNGEPVRSLHISLSGAGSSGRFADTDHEGRFRFEGLDAGHYELQVYSFQSQSPHREELDLAGDRDVVIELRTAAISGRVVDAEDRSPIAEAEVTLVPPEETFGMQPLTTTSDSRGAFRLRDVSEGTWKVRAILKGYAPEEVDVQVDAGAPLDGVELALHATEGVVLEVLLPSGRPPDEVNAVVLDAAGRVIVSESYTVGEEGRVRIASVAPGTWELLLDADGSAPVAVSVTAPGNAGRVILPQPGALSLKVPGLFEARVDAKVILTGADGKPFRAPWGNQIMKEFGIQGGSRRFERLPPGTWTVTVAATDGRSWTGSATVVPGGLAEVTLE